MILKYNVRLQVLQSEDLDGPEVNPSLQDRSIFKKEKGTLRVSGDRVFYTLQGEGVDMGQPSVFLRLHHCNLQCRWCDSWQTWDERSVEFWTESIAWTIEETRHAIEKAWQCENPEATRRLVITGGEPLIQRDSIEKLVEEMPNWNISLETNGTIMPHKATLENCQFNCSPKLSNATGTRRQRIKGKVLQTLNEVRTTFKFVVRTPEDVEELEREIVHPFKLDTEKVILMPEGVTSEEIWKNAQSVSATAKTKGYRLLGRQQIDLWGNERKT